MSAAAVASAEPIANSVSVKPMTPAEREWATYRFQPVDHLVRREFYIWDEAIERWQREGMPADADRNALFSFDPPGRFEIMQLGWCEPAFVPQIEECVIADEGEYQIIRDRAGRHVRVFHGRRHGFMPVYLKHAVASDEDWARDVAHRLRPDTPERWAGFETLMTQATAAARDGKIVTLRAIGGYMYLRALCGPEDVCYLFVDNPALIHRMMESWLTLADAVAARVQQHVPIDELFLAEDICYRSGLLISPAMVREFLFPYYQELMRRIRARQTKRLYLQIDTDGNCFQAIDLYLEIGMDMLSPLEIAAGNDLLEIARHYPRLALLGGIDKRILAEGRDAIDAYLEHVIPPLVARGGFIPTCDHGVPDDVSFENYVYYRRRLCELDH